MISTPQWDGEILPKCHRAGNKRPPLANLHVQMSIIFVAAAVEAEKRGRELQLSDQ